MRLTTAERVYGPDPNDPEDLGRTPVERVVRRAWPHTVAPYPKAFKSVKSATKAYAEVNHGRWIVNCPFCVGAQMASEDDHRFLCIECLHRGTPMEMAFIPVVWPKDAEKIEDLLVIRPTPNQNWVAGESVANLELENQGVGR